MTNWYTIILGLVALSSVAWAENSYLVIVPKLFKIGTDNQVSVFIGASSQPVEVKFELTIGKTRLEGKTTCKPGETRNATLSLPKEWPVGAGELIIVGTGGVSFEEKRDVIICDDSHVILVQTSSSSYRPGEIMEIRVVATDDKLIPIQNGLVNIEIYDSMLKLVAEYQQFPILSGLTETISFPLAEHLNVGTWLVSATIGNTTSSLQVLVARPVTPSFDVKAVFQRFLLRTEKTLRGVVELSSDWGKPIFGRATIAIGQITEQDLPSLSMLDKPQAGLPPKRPEQGVPPKQPGAPETHDEEWRKWKSQTMEIAGRIEFNYDLASLFNVDLTRALAVQVYIEVTDLISGQSRVIRHVIPVFTRDVVYDIRPLQFEAGVKNEFEVIAKRPDGKPSKMENMIVTVRMLFPGEKKEDQPVEKVVEVKEFYTRGRNDIGLFSLDIPEKCIGVLMMITPLAEDGQQRGYRTHAVPLMPTPRRRGNDAKLSIELAPSSATPVKSAVDDSVISTQIATVGKTSNFYIQVLPLKSVEKFDPLPMSYVLLTNGKIVLTGEFTIQPSKECQNKQPRSVLPEKLSGPSCVFNGTLSFPITRDMIPYSTLLVYTFQPSFGFNVAETYHFSVAGLFQSTLALNATVVPYTGHETLDTDLSSESSELLNEKSKVTTVSDKAQGKTRIELSFTGTPESTVGLNVFEFDATLQGLSAEITKERLLQYLTRYEQVPISGMPKVDDEKTVASREVREPSSHGESEEAQEVESPAARGMESKKSDYSASGDSNYKKSSMDSNKYDHPSSGDSHESSMESKKHDHPSSADSNYKKSSMQSNMGNSKVPMKARGLETEDNEEIDEEELRERELNEAIDSREPRLVTPSKEYEQVSRQNVGLKVRYPVEKLVFGIPSSRFTQPVEGDDAYLTSTMGRFYGEDRTDRASTHYRRKSMKSRGQYDVNIGDNDFVMATSIPRIFVPSGTPPKSMPGAPEHQPEGNYDDMSEQQGGPQPPVYHERPQFGTPAWYKKMHSKLSTISKEAFIFMHSGLSIVTDFDSLRIPTGMQRFNMSSALAKFRTRYTINDRASFNIRGDARELLAEYMLESDASMMMPPAMFEEQTRNTYYRSVFFNSSRIGAQGTGKVVLPRIEPYSTWLASGFSLSSKSGLAIAQPIRLPTNQGLFVLANFPHKVQVGEHALLTYGVTNYLGKDLSNVVVRIRASADFDLIEQTQPERVASASGKDYTVTIPNLKTLGVETRNIVLVPKRAGVIKILIEVESEFGGDYELLTTCVRESGIKRTQVSAHLFDLTGEKKTFGPFVEKITQSPFLRYVKFAVSGTGLDRFVKRYTMEINTLLGIDRALVRLYRAIGLRTYLNATSQTDSYLFNMTTNNITTAYQKLQLYSDYNGSYSFVSEEGNETSSLYLTSLAFGAMISPIMSVRDNVTLNRTLNFILSHQQPDGSFDDAGPCLHKLFCTGELRRESMTALVLYSLTRHNASLYAPEFIRQQLFNGEQSPVMRAQRFLESRVPAIKSNLMVLTLVEVAFMECNCISEQLRQRIHDALVARQLTVVPEDGSKYLKIVDDKFTLDEQLLVNAMTATLYARFYDFQTTSAIARYIVSQIETHPHYDNVIDAIFHTDAWLHTDCLFRKKFGTDKFAVTVDVTTDNGQKKQFKIDAKNIDITQKLSFKLPVQTLTYSVSGFGLVGVCVKQVFVEKQPPTTSEVSPFQLTQEFSPMPWLNEIKAKTCVTYTPTQKQGLVATEKPNNTVVVEVQLPSAMRVNLRQIGYFLSRVEEVIHFTFNYHRNKLNFFLNIPWDMVSKPICLEWCLERLSQVINYAPIEVRAYDYLQPEMNATRLVPVQIQPALLGYSFVDAVIKARPSLESLSQMQEDFQRREMQQMTDSTVSPKSTSTTTRRN